MSPEGKISLLIAEDNPHIRHLLGAAAARSGCFDPITAVEDGEAALQAVRNALPGGAPDFIISDLSMPRLTGVELVRALKADERTRSIPIAIMTSSDLPHDREDAFRAGVCAFEPKPQGFDALVRLLIALRASCCDTAACRL